MRKLFSLLILTLAAAPAMAAPVVGVIPEPEAMALLAIGGIAMAAARRKK